mgnify:CR=1 FL=1|jgi:hypothetical protein
MRLLKLNELLKPQDLHMINECKNRKTYDWLYLNTLLNYFDYQYSIVDIIRLNGTKEKYDLIKIEPYKSYNARYRKFLTDKNVSQKVVKYYINKLFPNVKMKTITRQYKYAPEIKNTYLALRSR